MGRSISRRDFIATLCSVLIPGLFVKIDNGTSVENVRGHEPDEVKKKYDMAITMKGNVNTVWVRDGNGWHITL